MVVFASALGRLWPAALFSRCNRALHGVQCSLSPPNAIPWQMQFSLISGPTPPAHLGDPAPELAKTAFARELHLGVKAIAGLPK